MKECKLEIIRQLCAGELDGLSGDQIRKILAMADTSTWKPAMDSLIEVVDWRVSNEEYLWLDVRVTRDDGIRFVHMCIVKDGPNHSDSLKIVDQRKES